MNAQLVSALVRFLHWFTLLVMFGSLWLGLEVTWSLIDLVNHGRF